MISRLSKSDCVGCGACRQICPVSCISMEEDSEGFLYPQIDVSICIGCNRCEEGCPVLSSSHMPLKTLPQAYVASAISQEDLYTATSGGAFLSLARSVIASGGAVVGAAYDQDLVVRHIVVETQEELCRIARSKYTQSDMSAVFPQIKELLQADRTVLFGGMTCQVYAVCAYCDTCGIDRSKLLLVDLVCLGVPTPKLLHEYLLWQSRQNSAKVSAISMRARQGHSMFGSNPLLQLEFEDGHSRTCLMDVDPYGRAFWSKLASRPSCHRCPFKTIGRISDITMGDCWFSRQLTGDKDISYDVTLCLAHSERGRMLLTTCRNLAVCPVPTPEAIKANGGMIYSSSEAHPSRDAFLSQLGTESFDVLVNRYLPSGIGFKAWSARRHLGRLIKLFFPRFLKQRSLPRQEREYRKRMERVIPSEAFVACSLGSIRGSSAATHYES